MSGGPRLPSRGYVVMSLDLAPEIISQALRQAQKRTYVPVFLSVGGPDDPHRLQSRVAKMSTPAQRMIETALLEAVQLYDGRWRPGVFSFMSSLLGGETQSAHQDYTTDDIARAGAEGRGCVPGSAIVTLEHGTSLRVFKSCFGSADPAKEAIIDVPPGYCLIFRGDLVHSGVGYTVRNHRLHCYLQIGDTEWVPDVVQEAHPHVLRCGHGECTQIDENSSRIRNHRHYCTYNPKGQANRDERNAKRRLATAAGK